MWAGLPMPLSQSLRRDPQQTCMASCPSCSNRVWTILSITVCVPTWAKQASVSEPRLCSLPSPVCLTMPPKSTGRAWSTSRAATSGVYARLPKAAAAKRCKGTSWGKEAMACNTASAAARHSGRACASSRARRLMAATPWRCAPTSPWWAARKGSSDPSPALIAAWSSRAALPQHVLAAVPPAEAPCAGPAPMLGLQLAAHGGALAAEASPAGTAASCTPAAAGCAGGPRTLGPAARSAAAGAAPRLPCGSAAAPSPTLSGPTRCLNTEHDRLALAAQAPEPASKSTSFLARLSAYSCSSVPDIPRKVPPACRALLTSRSSAATASHRGLALGQAAVGGGREARSALQREPLCWGLFVGRRPLWLRTGRLCGQRLGRPWGALWPRALCGRTKARMLPLRRRCVGSLPSRQPWPRGRVPTGGSCIRLVQRHYSLPQLPRLAGENRRTPSTKP
mmetsp:Transcript_28055/g.85910  ORF Transcript_28055/g.85910 Transcript_28055/m.85910 type:complete len:451 (+) Transcript_28055:969-2321(+)